MVKQKFEQYLHVTLLDTLSLKGKTLKTKSACFIACCVEVTHCLYWGQYCYPKKDVQGKSKSTVFTFYLGATNKGDAVDHACF